jgi:hypothetical protein
MRFPAHFGQWLEVVRRGRNVRRWEVAASLIYGQVKKCYQRRKLVRVSHGLASWHRGCSQSLLTAMRLLWTAQHRFHRASQSDRPTWHSRGFLVAPGPRLSNLHTYSLIWSGGEPTITDVASSRISPHGTGAATRARRQPSGPALPATDSSHGCRQNPSTLDGARSALVPLAKGFRLSGLEARRELDPVPGRWAKVPAEELGRSRIRERKGRSGRLIEEKTGPRAICRGSLNYPPSLTGAPP